MTGSFNNIDYRLRPAKHAERTMLCDIFRRLRFCHSEQYQYVGFGSVAFVDFRMVHRILGVTKMISIEEDCSDIVKDRFDKNKPYDCIKLIFGNSSTVLPQIDFTDRNIVWLDYDDAFCRSMVTDAKLVAGKLDSGSFIGVTFANTIPIDAKGSEKKLGQLKAQFPEFTDSDTKITDFTGGKIAEFARTVFAEELQTALDNADSGKPKSSHRKLHQICYFKYRDGASMTTLGWVVVSGSEAEKLNECDLSNLDFVSLDDVPFSIRVPKITPYETRELEKRLLDETRVSEVEWIPDEERSAFYDAYRYLPNFGVIESV